MSIITIGIDLAKNILESMGSGSIDSVKYQSSLTPLIRTAKDTNSKPHRRFIMRLYDRCTSTLKLRSQRNKGIQQLSHGSA